MKKRAQISIFLILSIVIVFASVFIFYISNDLKTTQPKSEVLEMSSFDIEPIKNYINLCIKQTSLEGITIIGNKGGYIIIPSILELHNTSYWYYEGINIQPSLNQTTNRLNSFIQDNLNNCLDLTTFKNRGFNITIERSPNVDTTFSKKEVFVDVKLPLTIKKDRYVTKISEFRVNLNVRFLELFSIAKDIVNAETKPGFTIWDRYEPINLDPKILIDYKTYRKDLLITITDFNTYPYYKLRFINKFE